MRTGAIESNAAPRESVQQAQAAGTPLDEAARELGMSVNGSAKVLAEYPRDLNKAVAELTNAIISLGGEA